MLTKACMKLKEISTVEIQQVRVAKITTFKICKAPLDISGSNFDSFYKI